jgi:type II secretory pathway pseudopilin PulG
MTMHIPRINNTAYTGRSAVNGDIMMPHRVPIGRLAVILALLAAIFLAQLVTASTARADDRKTRVITFLSSGIKTAATAQSTAFDVSSYTEGQIFIDVTAEAGTSTLDVTVQTSPDNATWYTHTTVGQISAIGQTRAAITNFGNYLRINYVVGGTSFTFSVAGVFKN